MSNLSATLILLLAAALAGAPQRGTAPTQRGVPPKGRDEPKPKDGEGEEDVAKKYFEIADYDGNGWITISEARPALGIDRAGFALFDQDGDGRISPAEFKRRYDKLIQKGGAFPAPIGKSGLRTTEEAAPADVALRFDQDGDGVLDRSEVRAFLTALHSRLETDVAMAKFDRDGSQRLEKEEIAALTAFLSPGRRSHPPPRVASIEELFGKSLEREERPAATQIAPRIVGPVPVFRRLDLDQSGKITYEDLNALRRPIRLPVRIAAVVATLDTNNDGAVDSAELDASMAGPEDGR